MAEHFAKAVGCFGQVFTHAEGLHFLRDTRQNICLSHLIWSIFLALSVVLERSPGVELQPELLELRCYVIFIAKVSSLFCKMLVHFVDVILPLL